MDQKEILMYQAVLLLHSWTRWAVLAFAVVALYRAYSGWRAAREWNATDKRWATMFVHTTSLQLVLGLLLYGILSPAAQAALANLGAAMRDRELRFWGVEHMVTMIIATGIVHGGFSAARRAAPTARSHRIAAIAFTLALVVVLLGIPWPWGGVARPLFRFG
jgi:hypothetical protein